MKKKKNIIISLLIFTTIFFSAGINRKLISLASNLKQGYISPERKVGNKIGHIETYNDFEIKNYNINLDVSKDLKVKVKEDINVNFNKPMHGIYKFIGTRLVYTNKDNETQSRRTLIKDLNALGEEYKVENIGKGKKQIRIGSPSAYVEPGIKNYSINYLYDMGKDPYESYDEFIFHAIGDYWHKTIENVSFQVNMPKELKDYELKFFYDKFRQEDITDSFNIEVKDNKIIATLDNNKLIDKHKTYVYSGITIDILLPNNYFEGGSNNYGYKSIMLVIISVIGTIVIINFWFKYGRNYPKEVETVEFYPPRKYDAADIGYIYNNSSSKNNVFALIVGLAAKNYLKIEVEGKKRKEKIYVTLLKDDTSKLSENEKIVVSHLKKEREELSENLTLYKAVEEVASNQYANIKYVINDEKAESSLFTSIFIIIVSLGLLYLSYVVTADLNPKYFYVYLIGFLTIPINILFTILMPRKTKEGEKLKAEVNGFRNFLLKVEKEKLEELVEENPAYFYEILPYTYTLNVSKKWIDKFEKLNIKMPEEENISSTVIYMNSYFNSNIYYPIDYYQGGGSGLGSGGGNCSSCGGGGGW